MEGGDKLQSQDVFSGEEFSGTRGIGRSFGIRNALEGGRRQKSPDTFGILNLIPRFSST
jgi:hypothetical protein